MAWLVKRTPTGQVLPGELVAYRRYGQADRTGVDILTIAFYAFRNGAAPRIRHTTCLNGHDGVIVW